MRRFLILPDVEQTLTTLNNAAVIPADPAASAVPAMAVGTSLKALSANAAEKAEKEMILRTLAEVNWNRKQAARRLDICYKSLLIKLRRWQLGRRTELRTGESEKAYESGRKPIVRSASWKSRPAAAHPNEQRRAARSEH